MDLRRRSAHTGGLARAAHGPVPRRKHSRRNEAADRGDKVTASYRLVRKQLEVHTGLHRIVRLRNTPLSREQGQYP